MASALLSTIDELPVTGQWTIMANYLCTTYFTTGNTEPGRRRKKGKVAHELEIPILLKLMIITGNVGIMHRFLYLSDRIGIENGKDTSGL